MTAVSQRTFAGAVTAECRVLTGVPAVESLHDPRRTREWRALVATSPSSTVYQAPAFARAWWRVYGASYQLAIAEALGPDGGLVGQFVLVRPIDGTADWKPIGVHQCEYPAVLAQDDDRDLTGRVLTAAREALDLAHLKFLFLPPHAPVDAYTRTGTSYLRRHPRPLRHFDESKGAGKRTKGKLSKLRQLGASAAVFRDPDDIRAFLVQFSPMHDQTQEERGYGTPFKSDPSKDAFLIALAEEERLVHAAALLVGDRLVAAIVSVQNGPQLVLGLMTHAKELEDLSPAACLIHLLPSLYAGSDVTTLDLTPGGAYKDRFATSYDTAYALDVAWSPLRAVALVARREIGPVARRLERRVRVILGGRPGP